MDKQCSQYFAEIIKIQMKSKKRKKAKDSLKRTNKTINNGTSIQDNIEKIIRETQQIA